MITSSVCKGLLCKAGRSVLQVEIDFSVSSKAISTSPQRTCGCLVGWRWCLGMVAARPASTYLRLNTLVAL